MHGEQMTFQLSFRIKPLQYYALSPEEMGERMTTFISTTKQQNHEKNHHFLKPICERTLKHENHIIPICKHTLPQIILLIKIFEKIMRKSNKSCIHIQ
jgi:hypothetical protein